MCKLCATEVLSPYSPSVMISTPESLGKAPSEVGPAVHLLGETKPATDKPWVWASTVSTYTYINSYYTILYMVTLVLHLFYLVFCMFVSSFLPSSEPTWSEKSVTHLQADDTWQNTQIESQERKFRRQTLYWISTINRHDYKKYQEISRNNKK